MRRRVGPSADPRDVVSKQVWRRGPPGPRHGLPRPASPRASRSRWATPTTCARAASSRAPGPVRRTSTSRAARVVPRTPGRSGSRTAPRARPPGAHDDRSTYDAAGHLSSLTDWLGATTSFAYDADGNLVTTGYPNGTTATSTYDAADRMSATADAQGASPLASFSYTRCAAGLVASVAQGGAFSGSQSFSYDALNQLTSGAGAGYSYDAANTSPGSPAAPPSPTTPRTRRPPSPRLARARPSRTTSRAIGSRASPPRAPAFSPAAGIIRSP